MLKRHDPSGFELPRRALLGGMTALLVARILVPGEDPGLIQNPLGGAPGLVLNFLWLILGVGWAACRAWSSEPGRQGKLEIALLGLGAVILAFGIFTAQYKHPAWLIACEGWVVLLVFCMIRQIPRGGEEIQKILGALLATGISLAGQSIYQVFLESPPETPNSVFNSPWAGYLVLILPVAVGGAWACWRARGSSLMTLLMLGFTLLLGGALWFTQSRVACVSLAGVGLALFCTRWTAMPTFARSALYLIILLTPALILLAVKDPEWKQRVQRGLEVPLDGWASTWTMLQDHPRGVGLGNFVRFFPRYVSPGGPILAEPPSLLLEIGVGCGTWAAIIFLVGAWLLFWKVFAGWRDLSPHDELDKTSSAVSWEYYLGGMVGLTLGFILLVTRLAGEQQADRLIHEGLVAGVRSLIWFGSFALLERIPWSPRTLIMGLVGGVGACFLYMTLTGGLFLPSVAQPAWVLTALALNVAHPDGAWDKSAFLPRLAFPVMAGLAFGYLFFVFYPTVSCIASLYQAQPHYAIFHAKLEEARKKEGADQRQASAQIADKYLKKAILENLKNAYSTDPSNSYPLLELIRWNLEDLKLRPKKNEAVPLESLLQSAKDLDPANPEVYILEFQLRLLQTGRTLAPKKPEIFNQALQALREAIKLDPTHPGMRFQMSEAYAVYGDKLNNLLQAEKAMELDRLTRAPQRKLTDQQRQKLESLLGQLPSR